MKNKLNKKINKFFKKYFLMLTLISFIFIVFGLVFKYIDSLHLFSIICFIIATIFSGIPILYRAINSLRFKVISIELLVSIAFIGALFIKEYSESAIVTFLFQFGMFLEQKTLEKTRNAIKDLTKLTPLKALKLNEDKVEEIEVDDVEVNDILIVKEGMQVPVDGEIIDGSGFFIESSITGESKPIKKIISNFIYAGSILETGYIKMKALRVGEDTTFNKIISLVEEAEDSKSPLERFIDRFAKYYTPIVILISLISLFLIKIIKGYFDIDKSITILVLACPGALVIGVPISSVAGIGRGAKDNILFKGGDSLHSFAKTDVFVFDKTGTLTKGDSNIISYQYYGENEKNDLSIVASLENSSSHPLRKAFISYCNENNISFSSSFEIETIKGKGIKGNVDSDDYLIGNQDLINENEIIINLEQQRIIDEYKNHDSTIVLVSKNKALLFIFEIGDEIKEDAKRMINSLKKKGIKRIIMLTGDNINNAKYVSSEIGITEYYASLLPEDKLNKVKELIESGLKVTFVGDGINDSPSLAYSTTGISMGNGTDVALETSDVVLIRSNLNDLINALEISKKSLLISYENILISIATVIFLIIGLFLGFIHMSLGMFVHEGSIFIVILNAMRLLIRRKK